MHDGSITFSTALDNRGLERDLRSLEKKIEKKERDIADLRTKRDSAREKSAFDAAALDAEKAKLQEIKDRLSDIRGMAKDTSIPYDKREDLKAQIPAVREELADQRTRVRGLQGEWNRLENRIDGYNRKLEESTQTLDRQKEEAGALCQELGAASRAAGGSSTGGSRQPKSRLNAYLEKSSSIYRRMTGAIQSTGEASAVLQEIAGTTGGRLSGAFQAAGSAIGGFRAELSGAVATGGPYIAAALLAAEAVRKLAASFLDFVRSALGAGKRALKLFGELGAALVAAGKRALSFAKDLNVFSKLSDHLSGKLQRLGSTIKSVLIFSVLYRGMSLLGEKMGAYLSVNASFMAALRRMQGALLTAFQPIYEVAVPALTALINVLARAAATVTQFFASLFGTTAKQAQTNTENLYEQAGATAAAGEAAEEAARQLAGFDEINKLEGNKSAGGGGAAGVDTGPLFDYEYGETPFDAWGEAFSAFLDKLLDGVRKLRDAFKDFAGRLNGWSGKVYDMFTFPGVLDKVKQLGRGLADALNDLVNWIDWYQLGQALGAGLNHALNFLTSFLYGFDWMNLGRRLAEFVNGLVSEIDWYEFGRLLWAGFKIGLETLAGFIAGLDMPQLAEAASNIIRGFFDEIISTVRRIPWEEIGRQIAEFLSHIDWYGTITGLLSAIGHAIEALFQMVKGFVENLRWSAIAEQIYTAVNDSVAKIDWHGIGRTLGGLFLHAFDFVRETIAGIDWYRIGADIAAFLNGIDWIGLLSGLAGAIAAGINAAVHTLGGLVGNLDWSSIGEAIGSAINRLVQDIDWEGLGRTFSDALNGMITLAATLLETVDWDAIGTAVETFLRHIDWPTLMMNVANLIIDWLGMQLQLAVLKAQVFLEIGGHLIEGLKKGILLAVGKIGMWLYQHLVQPIVDAVKGFFGIHSPSTVFAEIGENLIAGLLQGISDTWGGITGFFSEKIEALKAALSEAWEAIRKDASEKWEAIKTTLTGAWEAIRDAAREKFEEVRRKISEAWSNIKAEVPGKWEEIKSTLANAWDKVRATAEEKFRGIKDKIIEKMDEVKNKDWFATGKAIVDGILSGLESIWNSLTRWARSVKDTISGALSGAERSGSFGAAPSGGFGGTRAAVRSMPDISAYPIPALAKGAVIPPNREFMAVLGDQRSGTNVEAPLETIEQAVANVLGRMGGGSNRSQTVVLEVDGRELGRTVVKFGGAEYRRIGTRLTEART